MTTYYIDVVDPCCRWSWAVNLDELTIEAATSEAALEKAAAYAREAIRDEPSYGRGSTVPITVEIYGDADHDDMLEIEQYTVTTAAEEA
jgi:hypothetical protein